ncbi:hypothetical protein L9F63_021784, partial [Diploptera punctata]
ILTLGREFEKRLITILAAKRMSLSLESNSENPNATMVWIHGDAYQTGSGNIESARPDLLLEQGVNLVTLNYRLSALGFISTGDDVIPVNFGLKNQ